MDEIKLVKRQNGTTSVRIFCDGSKSKVRKSQKDECDINKIMERFNRTGKLPTMQTRPPQYGDARVLDYQGAQNLIKEAKQQFMALPAIARKAFGNDPQVFLEAINDNSQENVEKLLKLGILIPRKESPEEVLNRIAENTKPAEKSADLK